MLTIGFGPKMAIFPKFFFRQYRPEKFLLRYSKTIKRLSRLQKQEVQKLEKKAFFPRGLTHGFGPKMAIFTNFFFRHCRLEKILIRYSETINRLFRLQKHEVQKVAKMAIYPTFLFTQYRSGKCLLRYFRTKKLLSRL